MLFFEETDDYIFYREQAVFLIFVSFFRCNFYLCSDPNLLVWVREPVAGLGSCHPLGDTGGDRANQSDEAHTHPWVQSGLGTASVASPSALMGRGGLGTPRGALRGPSQSFCSKRGLALNSFPDRLWRLLRPLPGGPGEGRLSTVVGWGLSPAVDWVLSLSPF